jgi:hypothetical protein
MIRVLVVWLILGCAAVPRPASAQGSPVAVRTGEHGGFTRVVIPFVAARAWRFGRVSGGYALDPGPGSGAFVLDGAFDRIARTRLGGLREAQGRLELDIACTCHATAVAHRGTWVVVDIFDGPAPPGSPFETALDRPRPAPAPGVLAGDRPAWARSGPAPGWSLPTTAVPQGEPMPATAGAADTPAPPDAADPGLSGETALIRDMARAMAQGLLSPAVDPLPALPVDPPPAPAQSPPPPAPTDSQNHLRILAESSIDRDSVRRPSHRGVSPTGRACLPDSDVAVADWGGPAAAATDLAARRNALLGEFDIVDPGALRALARYQIHLGFGAEAAATLALLPSGPDPVLLELARLVDRDPGGPTFDSQHDCPGSVALWAVLAASRPEVTSRADRPAVLAAFSALPLHLRRHLAPGLADLFLAAGDPAGAGAVRNALARAPGSHGSVLDLVEARIDMDGAGAGAAASRLHRVLPEAGAAAPEVMVSLLHAGLAAGTATEPQGHVAEALAFELRDTATGQELARLAVEAALAAGAPDRAVEMLDRSGLPDDQVAALRVAIARRIVAMSDDLAFLQTHFALAGRLLDHDLPPDVTRETSRRLRQLGFEAPSTAFPADPPETGTGEGMRPGPVVQADDRAAAARDLPGPESVADTLMQARNPEVPGPSRTPVPISPLDQARAALADAAGTRARLMRSLGATDAGG